MDKAKLDMLRSIGMGLMADRVEQGLCPMCGLKITSTEFRDVKSMRENEISGMCQKCQDKTFGR